MDGAFRLKHMTADEFGQDTEAFDLAWLGGDHQVTTLHGKIIPGFTFSPSAGYFVWSKRVRRTFQPTNFYTFATPDIDFMKPEPAWDGAGLIAREFLDQITVYGDTDLKQKRYWAQLQTTQRFEFTLVRPEGQLKGHLIVSSWDELDGHDMRLALDFKKGVAFNGSYLSLKPVHCNPGPYLYCDLQSAINLPVFALRDVQAWHQDCGDRWLAQIEQGTLIKAFPDLEPDKLDNWPALEFLMGGGHPMWFPTIVNSLANSHIRHLEHETHARRFPLPGYAAYLTSDLVLDEYTLTDNQVVLDLDKSSLVVSSLFYEQLCKILGGADMDDRCYCVPTQLGMLIWRSPNQWGEYWLALDYQIIQHGKAVQPTIVHIDPARLPTRIDNQLRHPLDLIGTEKADGTPEFDIMAFEQAVQADQANRGALGATVNLMMIQALLHGNAVTTLDFPSLEAIIDASVKTGADLSLVKDWVKNEVGLLLRIPSALADRARDGIEREQVRTFMDDYFDISQQHILDFGKQVVKLRRKCMAPAALIKLGEPYKAQGKQFRQVYGKALAEGGIERAFWESDRFLATQKEPLMVMAGAIYDGLLNEYDHELEDALVWQYQKGYEGISDKFLVLLRSQGLIAEPVVVDGKVLWYQCPEPELIASVKINGCWFNALRQRRVYKSMSDVPVEERTDWKQRMANACNRAVSTVERDVRGFVGRTIHFGKLGNRMVALTDAGHLLGYVDKYQENLIEDRPSVTIRVAFANDGNITVLF